MNPTSSPNNGKMPDPPEQVRHWLLQFIDHGVKAAARRLYGESRLPEPPPPRESLPPQESTDGS